MTVQNANNATANSVPAQSVEAPATAPSARPREQNVDFDLEVTKRILDPDNNNSPLKRLLENPTAKANATREYIKTHWPNGDTPERKLADFQEKLASMGIGMNLSNDRQCVHGIFALQYAWLGFDLDLAPESGRVTRGCDGVYGAGTQTALLRLIPRMEIPLQNFMNVSGDQRFDAIANDRYGVRDRAGKSRYFIEKEWGTLQNFAEQYKKVTQINNRYIDFTEDIQCVTAIFHLQKTLGMSGGDLDGIFGKKTNTAFKRRANQNG